MPDTDIGLTAIFDGRLVVAALLKPEELARRVAAVDGAVERQSVSRADVADIVAGGVQAGRFATPAERAHLASLLLWLAVRDEGVADSVRRGGVDLTWQISSPGTPGERWHLALSVGDRADAVVPSPDPEPETKAPSARPSAAIH